MGRQMRSTYSPFEHSPLTCVLLYMSRFNPRALVHVGLVVVEVDWVRFLQSHALLYKLNYFGK